MSRRLFVERERSLAAELSAKFRGSASIKIETLDFPFEKLRKSNSKNIETLQVLFKKQESCRDWEVFNHIPAVIDQEELAAALARAGISPEALLEARDGHLELDFPSDFRLTCFRGQHRALAAKEFLPPGSRRWTVDLYVSGNVCAARIVPVYH